MHNKPVSSIRPVDTLDITRQQYVLGNRVSNVYQPATTVPKCKREVVHCATAERYLKLSIFASLISGNNVELLSVQYTINWMLTRSTAQLHRYYICLGGHSCLSEALDNYPLTVKRTSYRHTSHALYTTFTTVGVELCGTTVVL